MAKIGNLVYYAGKNQMSKYVYASTNVLAATKITREVAILLGWIIL